MILTYNQCLERYQSNYLLQKAVAQGLVFRIEKGIYSDVKYVPELRIIAFKYPSAIFTLDSAFYYYNLTDTIPDKYWLATSRGAAHMADKRVKQVYENSDALDLGVVLMEYEGVQIKIYSRERMLVELLRNKNKFPFDYYKEVILNFRRILDKLDYRVIEDCACSVPKTAMIMDTLRKEVL